MSYKRERLMRALLSRGFVIIREGGSHTIVGKAGAKPEPVPRPREVNRNTTRRIVRNLGLDWDQIERELS